VALNECVRVHLAAEMVREVIVPEDPQIVGALGAALYASTKKGDEKSHRVIMKD
jgi:activator of 2-hydroxyglutaryl-CoA dehydratase